MRSSSEKRELRVRDDVKRHGDRVYKPTKPRRSLTSLSHTSKLSNKMHFSQLNVAFLCSPLSQKHRLEEHVPLLFPLPLIRSKKISVHKTYVETPFPHKRFPTSLHLMSFNRDGDVHMSPALFLSQRLFRAARVPF
jgi:hypothetical protein